MAGRTSRKMRKKSTPAKSWLGLAIVAVLLVAALAGLELLKTNGSVSPPLPMPATGNLQPQQIKPTLPPVSTAKKAVQHQLSSAPVKKPRGATSSLIKSGKPGRVAIIIDDMGTSVQEVQSLMGIGVPLTFSIIPGLSKATEVSRQARQNGYQVMIHLPMEPEGYPQRRLEKNGLLLAHSDAELRQRVVSYLQLVPGATGANNHMGSRFTANHGKMRVVLSLLKEKELYFVDSVTTSKSVGVQEARELGVKTAARQVFLDNVQDVAAIRKQLLELADKSRKRGSAIGICHPHAATIKALQEMLPELEKNGITFVTAGELVS